MKYTVKHRVKGNSLTPANLEPKAKTKLIKEISVLTKRRWKLSFK